MTRNTLNKEKTIGFGLVFLVKCVRYLLFAPDLSLSLWLKVGSRFSTTLSVLMWSNTTSTGFFSLV